MNEIQGERVRLVALNASQLELALDHLPRLEQELGFPIASELISPPVRQAIGIKLSHMAAASPEEYGWLTYWLIVIACSPYGAGMVGFKRVPNDKGEVEIGYGMASTHQNQGYMTEAVRALIAWALEQTACTAVIAETHRENRASQRVLQKAGLHVYGQTDDALFWRIEGEIPTPDRA